MQVQITDDQFAKLLSDSKDQFVEAALAEVKRRFQWSVGRVIDTELEPVVSKFIQTEIVPAVTERLAGSKSALIEATVNKADEIGLAFAEALVTELAATLGEGYKRRRLFETLFK